MIIDFHTHCFPEKIAERAIKKLSYTSGGLIPQTDGTLTGLKRIMEKSGVDISCVMNIATNPYQMKSVNDFAISINSGGVVSFGSVHPDAPDVLDELERIKAAGLKGVKFHPDYQGFFADDSKMKPIYKKIESLGLIMLFHAGFDYGFDAPFHGMPDNILGVLRTVDSPVIAAHWGGLNCGEEVIKKLCGLPVYFDISFGYGTMPRALQMRIIDRHGTDSLLFGSDCPWNDPAWDMRNLETLELSESDKEKILGGNAAALLGV